MTWTYYWAAGGHSQQPLYHQFPYKGCQVGCGAVAWAMLFCWADRQAALGNSYWAPRWGLYRENGGKGSDAVAPISMDDGVRNIIKEIRDYIDTFCVGSSSGATSPWNMTDAKKYFIDRTATKLDTHYNILGICESRLRNYARNQIKYKKTPAVIGTGWLSHYPLAYGYAWRNRTVRYSFLCWSWTETVTDRCFYVNQGWGGSGNGWITASTWFAGRIFPE